METVTHLETHTHTFWHLNAALVHSAQELLLCKTCKASQAEFNLHPVLCVFML